VLTDEWFTGQLIPGSRRVPLDQVGREQAALGLPKDTTIVVYCTGLSCPQSHQAAEKLVQFGFTNVWFYAEGLEGWTSAGHAVAPSPVGQAIA
jgi:rhodanese-related sulfurtransferase